MGTDERDPLDGIYPEAMERMGVGARIWLLSHPHDEKVPTLNEGRLAEDRGPGDRMIVSPEQDGYWAMDHVFARIYLRYENGFADEETARAAHKAALPRWHQRREEETEKAVAAAGFTRPTPAFDALANGVRKALRCAGLHAEVFAEDLPAKVREALEHLAQRAQENHDAYMAALNQNTTPPAHEPSAGRIRLDWHEEGHRASARCLGMVIKAYADGDWRIITGVGDGERGSVSPPSLRAAQDAAEEATFRLVAAVLKPTDLAAAVLAHEMATVPEVEPSPALTEAIRRAASLRYAARFGSHLLNASGRPVWDPKDAITFPNVDAARTAFPGEEIVEVDNDGCVGLVVLKAAHR